VAFKVLLRKPTKLIETRVNRVQVWVGATSFLVSSTPSTLLAFFGAVKDGSAFGATQCGFLQAYWAISCEIQRVSDSFGVLRILRDAAIRLLAEPAIRAK